MCVCLSEWEREWVSPGGRGESCITTETAQATTRQLLQTGSDCGFICNYLPLRCRCRQQLPYRMGTVMSESEVESKPCVLPQLSPVAGKPMDGRPAQQSHLRLRRQLLLRLWPQLWPSHLTRLTAWLVAAHALIIAGQLRSTWSHDRMAKWHYHRTSRHWRLSKATEQSPTRANSYHTGVAYGIPAKPPHRTHKFCHIPF